MQGIIVYNREDAKRNWWFIDEMTLLFKKYDVDITLKIEEELTFDDLPDFVIYRARHHENIVKFEVLGVRVFNNSLTNKTANDKLLTYKLGKELGFNVLKTTKNLDEVDYSPIVMKSVDGHGGNEVFLLNSKDEAKHVDGVTYIYQPLSDEPGVDMRVYVLGKEVKVAIKRTSETDWRSNYSLGGQAVEVEIPQDVRAICEVIAKQLDSDLIGIDFIRDKGQWVLNEIEDPVGCRMVYHYSSYNIFQEFVAYIMATLGK